MCTSLIWALVSYQCQLISWWQDNGRKVQFVWLVLIFDTFILALCFLYSSKPRPNLVNSRCLYYLCLICLLDFVPFSWNKTFDMFFFGLVPYSGTIHLRPTNKGMFWRSFHNLQIFILINFIPFIMIRLRENAESNCHEMQKCTRVVITTCTAGKKGARWWWIDDGDDLNDDHSLFQVMEYGNISLDLHHRTLV